jgi:hypothetical protein
LISVRSEVQILPGPPPRFRAAKARGRQWDAQHPAKGPGIRIWLSRASWRFILRRAALAASFGCHWRRPPPVTGGGPPVTGGVAQLGERLLCKQEVIGSIPFTSTMSRRLMVSRQRDAQHPAKARSGGRGSRWSLKYDRRKHSLPPAGLLSARSLTCEERSVTETGVSFARVRRLYAAVVWGMFARLMR